MKSRPGDTCSIAEPDIVLTCSIAEPEIVLTYSIAEPDIVSYNSL